MATFPTDSVRTKNWGTEILMASDLEGQFDLLHSYFQACLNSSTGHTHTGAANQGPKLSPANMVIASQAAGDTLYASSVTAWARLAKGTAAQVLSMNAGATAPQWESAGTSANNLVRLDGDAKLPAVDGSALTGLGAGTLKAWVNFNGAGTVAIRASGNVSSITDNGTGDYTVNFTTAMPDANYAVSGSVRYFLDTNYFGGIAVKYSTGDLAVGAFRIETKSGDQATRYDYPSVYVVIFR